MVLVEYRENRLQVKKQFLPRTYEETWWNKSYEIAEAINRWAYEHAGNDLTLAIEEPFMPYDMKYARGAMIVNRFFGILYDRLTNKLFLEDTILVSPTQAKKALTGRGNAKKGDMIQGAADYFVTVPKSQAGREAIADAIGVAVAAWKLKGGVYAKD